MKNKLEQLFNKFISECKYSRRLRSETIRGYSSVYKTFLRAMPEVTSIELLTHDTLSEFFKRIETRQRVVGRGTIKSGVRDSTIKTYWHKLNCFFEWLRVNGHIDKNPLERITPPEPVYDDSRALEMNNIHKILSAITLHSQNSLMLKRDTLMVSLLTFCGLRKGEFISLKVIDVDMEHRLLTVKAETSKSKTRREVPINYALMIHLQEYLIERNKHGYKTEYLLVSNNSDTGLTVHGLKHWVKRLNDLSGVKFHLHRFRHSFASNLARKDVGTTKIQRLMGHKRPEMTESYLRSVKSEDLREDIDKLSF